MGLALFLLIMWVAARARPGGAPGAPRAVAHHPRRMDLHGPAAQLGVPQADLADVRADGGLRDLAARAWTGRSPRLGSERDRWLPRHASEGRPAYRRYPCCRRRSGRAQRCTARDDRSGRRCLRARTGGMRMKLWRTPTAGDGRHRGWSGLDGRGRGRPRSGRRVPGHPEPAGEPRAHADHRAVRRFDRVGQGPRGLGVRRPGTARSGSRTTTAARSTRSTPSTGALKRTIKDAGFTATPRFGGGEAAGYWRDRDLESLAYDGANDTLYVFSGSCCTESVLPTVLPPTT